MLDQYFTLGKTGLKVSRLALGTMTFGTEWGWGADKEGARAQVDAYLEAGGNFFDTANGYTGGTAERWLGELIAERGVRQRAVIATKFSFNFDLGNPHGGGNGRKAMVQALDASLKRLGTDYIDLYILHCWDRVTPVEEVMRAFDDVVRAGKVLAVGLSNVPAWYASRAQTLAELRGLEPISSLQLEYSLVERHIEIEHVPLGVQYGMGVTAWSPLASGFLSGKYRSADGGKGGQGSGRLDTLKGSTNVAFQKFTDRNWRILAELEAVSEAIGRPMAEVAINWTANRPGIASVILGATRPEQLHSNLSALAFTIPPELSARLDAVSAVPTTYPYTFFEADLQGMIHGGTKTATKPLSYALPPEPWQEEG